jgi:hypothetical protein
MHAYGGSSTPPSASYHPRVNTPTALAPYRRLDLRKRGSSRNSSGLPWPLTCSSAPSSPTSAVKASARLRPSALLPSRGPQQSYAGDRRGHRARSARRDCSAKGTRAEPKSRHSNLHKPIGRPPRTGCRTGSPSVVGWGGSRCNIDRSLLTRLPGMRAARLQARLTTPRPSRAARRAVPTASPVDA